MSLKAPEQQPFTHDTTETNSRNWKRPVIGLVALGAVLGAGLTGYKASGNDKAPAERDTTEPVASAPVTPGKSEETQPANPEGESTTAFGISAAEFEANPEQLAREFYAQLNEYYIAGADEAAATADRKYEITMDEYIHEISEPIDIEFIDNLFVEGWQDNPELAEYVHSVEYVAQTTRQVRIMTYSGGTDNIEPYVRESIVDEVVATTDPLTTSVRWHGQDNRDMNIAEDVTTGEDPNQNTGGSTFTWTNVSGQLKISSFTPYSG